MLSRSSNTGRILQDTGLVVVFTNTPDDYEPGQASFGPVQIEMPTPCPRSILFQPRWSIVTGLSDDPIELGLVLTVFPEGKTEVGDVLYSSSVRIVSTAAPTLELTHTQSDVFGTFAPSPVLDLYATLTNLAAEAIQVNQLSVTCKIGF
jgi:hypothetical protein